MQESVDAAQVDERAEIHHVADGAAADLSLGQFLHQLLLVLFTFAFQNISPGKDDVSSLPLECRDFGGHLLVDELRQVRDVINIDLPGGHEGAHGFDGQFEAALVHAGDGALDDLPDLQRLPGDVRRRRALAGEDQQALCGVVALDVELQFLPDLRRLLELKQRDDALALAAEIDKDVLLADGDDPPAADALFGGVFGGRAAC